MGFAWSHSALEGFETCPHRHFRTRIAKDVPDPPGAEAQWGTQVHTYLEHRIRDKTPLPQAVNAYEPYVAKLESMVGPDGALHAEQKIALTRDLKPTTYFAKDVWLRVVIDVTLDNGPVVSAFDWKTGKRKLSSTQLDLTAAVIPAVYPEAVWVKTGFLWLKDKAIDTASYDVRDNQSLWDRFAPRVERMERAVARGDFPKKPSGLCRKWCPVRDCEFHGK